MSAPSSSSPGDAFQPSSASQEAFREYLRREEEGDTVDFDAFCSARPELEEDLRQLRSNWERLERRFSKRRDEPGAIALDSMAGEGTELSQTSTQLLARLAERDRRHTEYTFDGEIARGGMGAILKIWDVVLRRTMAMKVVLGRGESLDDQGAPKVDEHQLSRFLEEAQITGQLDHPGIVPVHDLGMDQNGRVYFTMPLVKGEDLKRVFEMVEEEEEGWTRTRVLGVLLKVCDAMAFAHSKGVIHRDLKPANIMVGRFGEVYVMDWGLAKVLGREEARPKGKRKVSHLSSISLVRTDRREDADSDPDSPLVTMDGDVVGTPAYMSPEQAEGRVEDVGRRSDVYSVGAMLYQLLTGSAPYTEKDKRLSPHTVLSRALAGPPEPLSKVARHVSTELVAICEKAMSRDLEARYEDMLGLAEDIRAFLEGRVVTAYETGALAEFKKWVVRNKLAAAGIAASVLLTIVFLAAFAKVQADGNRALQDSLSELGVQKREADDARRAAEDNAESARIAEARASQLANDARQRGYVAAIRAADYSLRLGEPFEARRQLLSCEETLRGWEWKHLWLASDTSRMVRLEGGPVDKFFSFSSDLSRAAYAGPDGAQVIDIQSGRTLVDLGAFRITDFVLLISANASRVVWGSTLSRPISDRGSNGYALDVLDADTGEHLAQWGLTSRPFVTALNATGSMAALVYATSIDLFDLETGTSLGSISLPGVIESAALSPDGTSLAMGQRLGRATLWDVETREQRFVLEGLQRGARVLSFSPDGRWIGAGCSDGSLRLWDAYTGGLMHSLLGHKAEVNVLRFSSDGKLFATGSTDLSIRVWDVETGEERVSMFGHTDDEILDLGFGPNGELLGSAGSDGSLRLWKADGPVAQREFAGHTGLVSSLATSPDGRFLLSGSSDRTLRLWDCQTGRSALAPAGELLNVIYTVAFAPDGKLFASSGTDKLLRVWKTSTMEELFLFEGHTRSINQVAFHPGGSQLASASNDKSVRVWDALNREEVLRLEGHSRGVKCLAYSPDGTILASGSDDDTIRLWDASTGALLQELVGHSDSVYALAFSPDGRQLASGAGDDTVRLWDVETGRVEHLLIDHEKAVRSLSYGPAGERLASASDDGTVRVWDPLHGQLLVVLRGDRGFRSVTFSPDGRRLFAGMVAPYLTGPERSSEDLPNPIHTWETEATL